MIGKKSFLMFACAVCVLAIFVSAASAEDPEVYFAPDVPGQFDAITKRAEALGFGIGDSINPDLCRHYQGLARNPGPGTPYLFLSKSGNKPASVPACLQTCDVGGVPVPCTSVGDGPGQLLVIRMGSRNASGERLRSNRLVRDEETSSSPPSSLDRVVTSITFGQDGWPDYGHPGGMQIVGDILVVPLETPYSGGPGNLVMFVDISQPEIPELIGTFEPFAGAQGTSAFKAGLAGIITESTGHYLMLLTGNENKEVRVYRSLTTDIATDPDGWELLDVWSASGDILSLTQDELDLGQVWPVGGGAHQAINFVREGGPNGQLYMIGGRDTNGGLPFGDDKFDLYRVEWQGSQFKPVHVDTRHLEATPSSEDSPLFNDNLASFAAGVAAYVSPSGNLILYATEHDNDGPQVNGVHTIKGTEFRTIDMAWGDSASYRPAVHPGGPYQVPEGSAIGLFAGATVAATKAWVQLWADPDYDDRYIVADYPDRFLDDFDDFKDLDDAEANPFASGFSDQASSARWFAPVGCTIQLNDDDIEGGDDPGSRILTLNGTGSPERFDDLDDVEFPGGGDADDELTSLQFHANCDAYYGAVMSLAWDLDRNGSFETPGNSPALDATLLDGPLSLLIPVRARHPLDSTAAGTSPTTYVPVEVTNVPPQLRDVIVGSVPENGIASLEAEIVDPAPADSFEVTIDWKDGPLTVLNLPAGTTSFSATHRYPDDNPTGTPADEYAIDVVVVDDDGGADDETVVSTVSNLPPVVDAGAACERIDEGDTWSRSGSFTDVGTQDTHVATVDYDDGAGPEPLPLAAGKTFELAHTYDDDGVFDVSVTLIDDDTGVGTDVPQVRVTNLDPFFSIQGSQFVEGALRHETDVLLVPDATLPIQLLLPSIVSPQSGLDALDVQPNGDILFSTRTSGVIFTPGGLTILAPGKLYRRSAGDDSIAAVPDFTVALQNVDAIDELADGTYAFSTAGNQIVFAAGAAVLLNQANVYRFDPADGSITLFWNTAAAGVPTLDMVDVLAGGRLLFSTSATHFAFLGGAPTLLLAGNIYRFDPQTGALELIFDGSSRGLAGNLDAGSVGSADGEFPETCN
ncbi:MAG: hypothetical protein GY716_17635 [bacterium]|nr:hypothetical protein [bacterium]